MRAKVRVRVGAASPDLRQPAEHVAVELGQLLVGDRVLLRVVVVQVAQHVARRVAQLAIGVRSLLDDTVADADVLRIVGGGG